MLDGRAGDAEDTERAGSVRRTLIASLLVAFAGSIVGLVAVVIPGVAGTPESILMVCSTVVSGILLGALFLSSRVPASGVAVVASLYFTVHLSTGTALVLWDRPHIPQTMPYLLWFFALLCFNKFSNFGYSRRLLDFLITAAPLALVACAFLIRSDQLERGESALLVVFSMSYLAYALLFNRFADYRDRYVAGVERASALDRQNAILRESGERFRRLFDDAAIGIAELDPRGRVVSANSTLRGFINVGPGDDLAATLEGRSAVAWRAALAAVDKGEEPEERLELKPLASDRKRTLGCRLAYLPARGELPEGRIAVFVDVTERLELDAQLRQSQKLQAVGQLTGGIAHDFNNLLTVILGNSELLAEALEDQGDLRELADMSRSAAARGAELTQRLLAFARRQPLAPRVADCNELVNAARPLLERALGEAIQLEVLTDPNAPRVEVDAGQFEVALLNLSINARDAMPAGGKLVIAIETVLLDAEFCRTESEVEPGSFLRVSLADNGTGIPPEVIERVFEPFFTTKREAMGSGLGLSMVYGFVKQSGGLIKIHSGPQEGTTVCLYFPCADATRPEAVDRAAPVPVVGGSEHVLVVEDDDLVRGHVEAVIRGLGYAVTSAADAPEALQKLSQMDAVDLLFTDIVMPGAMNGRDLAREAEVLHPGLRVLYTSGYAETGIVHHGRLEPGVRLLSKPYRREQLAIALREALRE